MNKNTNDNNKSLVQQFIDQHGDNIAAFYKWKEKVRVDIHESIANVGVLKAVQRAHLGIDTIQRAEINKGTENVSCHSCTTAYCCHQFVDTCEAEVLLIIDYCKNNNIIISRQYLQQQIAYDEKSILFADCSACVFLKDNKCSIYPVRPGACRIHYVITPAENCNVRQYPDFRIGMLKITKALLILCALFDEGGKNGRLHELLLKYAQ